MTQTNQAGSQESDDESGNTYSAVILYYRFGAQILETVETVRRQSAKALQVCLVDNCSGDGVIEDLQAAGLLADVTVVVESENRGYAAGMNRGADLVMATGADYILLLTHEVRLHSDCVRDLVHAGSQSKASAVGPTLMLPGNTVWAQGGRIDWRGGARHIRCAGATQPTEVDWLDGSCVLVRSADFRGSGGVDERFFLYWEDVDFSLSLRERGPVVVVPTAHAVQAPSSDPPLYYVTRNRLWLWRRRGHRLKVVMSVLELIAWGLLWTVRKRGRGARKDLTAIARGLRDGLIQAA